MTARSSAGKSPKLPFISAKASSSSPLSKMPPQLSQRNLFGDNLAMSILREVHICWQRSHEPRSVLPMLYLDRLFVKREIVQRRPDGWHEPHPVHSRTQFNLRLTRANHRHVKHCKPLWSILSNRLASSETSDSS